MQHRTRTSRRSSRGRRVGVYFPKPLLAELLGEAKRQSRSTSYLAQVAWTIARDRIRNLPDAPVLPSE